MLKIGILGCGKQGNKHAKAMAKINQIKVFVADEDPRKAKKLAEEYSFHYADSLWECALDAIIICTPTRFHFDSIKSAFEKNIHVFCEKPLVSSSDEFKEIKELYKNSQSILYIGFVYKFSPVIAEIHGFCMKYKKSLGNPLHAIFRIGGRGNHQVWKHKEAAGGVINEMLVHMLDLTYWFLGELKIVSNFYNACMKPKRVINGKTVIADQPDYITLSAQSNKGAHVLFQADFVTQNFSQYFEIVFENGSCFGSIEQGVNSFFHLNGSERIILKNVPNKNLFGLQITYFLNLIKNRSEQVINTLQDYEAVEHMLQQIEEH